MSYNKRISYFFLLCEVLKQDLHRKKWYKHLFPWIFLLLGIASGIVVYIIPSEVFSEKLAWIIAIYSTFLTVQGILFAIHLFVFSIIFKKTSEPPINLIFKSLKLDIYYLFLFQHTTVFQILSFIAQIVGLLLSLEIDSIFWLKFLFFIALWSFSYAVKWLFGAVVLIRDFLWYTSKI